MFNKNYHINNKGQLVICPALIKCRKKDSSGNPAMHYKSPEHFQSHMKEIYNSLPDKNLPTNQEMEEMYKYYVTEYDLEKKDKPIKKECYIDYLVIQEPETQKDVLNTITKYYYSNFNSQLKNINRNNSNRFNIKMTDKLRDALCQKYMNNPKIVENIKDIKNIKYTKSIDKKNILMTIDYNNRNYVHVIPVTGAYGEIEYRVFTPVKEELDEVKEKVKWATNEYEDFFINRYKEIA